MKKQKAWGFVLPVALVAGVLVATPQVVAPTPAEAAPATTFSPSNPIKMERFYFYSSQSTKFVRPVVLQKKVGSSWKTIFSGKTAATGKFRFTVHTGSVDTLRAFSASISYGGKTYPQVATAPITVRPLTQTVSLTVAASTGGGTATAVTSPVRNGRGVTLQRASASGSSWTTMATGKVNGQGRGTFRIPTPPAGARYRIVMNGWNGAPGLASGPVAPSGTASPETTLSPAKPMKMEHFYFYSSVATQFVRPVVLQKKVGSSWKTIFSGKTATTGKFRFTVHTGSVDTLRALAAATTYQGTRYPELVTTPITVSPLDQKITLTMPKEASVNEAVTAQISADPVRSGRKVELQVQSGSGWTTLSSGAFPASGPLTLRFSAAAQGNYRYQVVQDAWNGAPSAASGASAMTISPDEVTVEEHAKPLTAAESDAVSKYDPSSGTIALTNPPATSTFKAGDVLAMPPRDDAPSGALVKVTKVATAGDTTTLTTTPVDLPDVVTNVPDDATDIGMTVTSTTFTPADGVTAASQSTSPSAGQKLAPRSRGISPMAVAELKLAISKSKQISDSTKATFNGDITLSPVVDLGLNTDWDGTVKGYKVGLGYRISSTISSSVTMSTPDIPPLELGTAHWTVAGAVGPVPVWMDVDAKLVLTITAQGKIEVSAKMTQSGESAAGITQSGAYDLKPKPYARLAATGQSPVGVSGSGTLGVSLGMNASASLYSIGGPFVEAGWKVTSSVAASAGTGGTSLSCGFEQGPYTAFGIKTGLFLSKLTKTSLEVSSKKTFPVTKTTGCPGGSTDPGQKDLAVRYDELIAGTVGQAYSTTLEATGGVRPYAWEVSSLPAGLSLNKSTGEITGTPSTAGTREFTAIVRDAAGHTASRIMSVVINDPTSPGGGTPSPSASAAYVDIPDKNLLNCIDATIGIPSGTEVTLDKAATVTELECHNMSISSIEGISAFTDLQIVTFFNNSIRDLSPLRNLKKLTELGFEENQISSLAPISGMSQLTGIAFEHNQIRDLSPLASLQNLTEVDLPDNEVSDISPLKRLTKIRQLDLSWNSVGDISALSGLTALVELDLSENSITNVSSLKSMELLASLSLSGNAIQDFSPLLNLRSLRTVSLANVGLTILGPIEGLSGVGSMTTLDVSENEISDLGPISAFTTLQGLAISGNRIGDIAPVAKLVNLTWLMANDNEIVDLSPLAKTTKLTRLSANYNQIVDLSPLVDISGLTWLSLWENKITDATPLDKLSNLVDLWLQSNPICDTNPSTAGCQW